MGDFAEKTNYVGQAMMEELLSNGGTEGSLNEVAATPEINGELSFESVKRDLDSAAALSSSRSDLFEAACRGFAVAKDIDEARYINGNVGDATNIQRDMEAVKNGLSAIDSYLNSRGRKKFLFFKGAVTDSGKQRINALSKARLVVGGLLSRLDYYSGITVERNRDVVGQRAMGSKIDANAYMEAYSAKGTNNYAAVKTIDSYNLGKLNNGGVDGIADFAHKVFVVFKTMVFNKDVFTRNKFTFFMDLVDALGISVIDSIAKEMLKQSDKGKMIREQAMAQLGSSSKEHMLMVSTILQTFVDFISSIRDANTPSEGATGENKAVKVVKEKGFLLMTYIDAYKKTGFWGKAGRDAHRNWG